MQLPILHEKEETGGVFYIEKEGKRLAEMTYSQAGDDRIIINNTVVDASLRGTGSGKELVLQAVEYARSHHLRIIPLCRFANSVFQKTTEIRDVL